MCTSPSLDAENVVCTLLVVAFLVDRHLLSLSGL